jgi:predicted lipoprotein with Yx(FWY)xxD motif
VRKKLIVSIAIAASALFGLAGCMGSGSGGYGAGSSSSSSTAPSTTAPAGATALATASSSLGTIVVDGSGLTAYVFDKDTAGSGTSACTGDCLITWPPVTTSSTTPTVTGVTGKVGTITTSDGKNQVTLDGLPLYYFVNDTAAGDVKGQGVQGIWWVVAPDGTKITTAATGSSGY